MPSKHQRGFIDPLSLAAIGFLVISLFVGTFVVSNRNISLDIRQRAKGTECASNSDCGSGAKCQGGVCVATSSPKAPTEAPKSPTSAPEPTKKPDGDKDKTPSCGYSSCGECQADTSYQTCVNLGCCSGAATPAPTTAPTSEPETGPAQCVADGSCIGPGDSCCSGQDHFDLSCGATETRCGSGSTTTLECTNDSQCGTGKVCQNNKCVSSGTTSTTTTQPTPTPSLCVADGRCIGPGESCCSGVDYFDTSCAPTEARCGLKTTPVPTIVTQTTLTPFPTFCASDGQCLGPGGSCCSGRDYFDTSCGATETRCGLKPTPTPTPFCSRFYQDNCPYGCTETSTGGRCNLTPTITPTPTPAPTAAVAQPYCSAEVVRDCLEGYKCSPSATGGFCVFSLTTTPTPTPAPDQYAVAAFATPENSIGEQITADLNYILYSRTSDVGTRLWAATDLVTFGALTNYGEVYSNINQQQPQSTYLEKAFSQQGLGASARLGGTAVGEFGGGAIILDALAGGAATLEAYTGVQVTIQTTLAQAPRWVVPVLRTGSVIAGNYAVAQGISACNEDPSSTLCASTIAGAQLGLLDDLARETELMADRAVNIVPVMIKQDLAAAQNLHFVNPSTNTSNWTYNPGFQPGDEIYLEDGTAVTLQEQLGSGATFQGNVYRGRTCTGETCAIKIFEGDDAFSTALRAEQERIMSTYATPQYISQGLRQPAYLGRVTDETGEAVGYAMDLVPGESLAQIRGTGGGITQQQAQQAIESLQRQHEITGLPHGDLVEFYSQELKINAGNIMFSDQGVNFLDPVGTLLGSVSTPDELIAKELDLFQQAIQTFVVSP